jgi:hypothetical protein
MRLCGHALPPTAWNMRAGGVLNILLLAEASLIVRAGVRQFAAALL